MFTVVFFMFGGEFELRGGSGHLGGESGRRGGSGHLGER